MFAVCLSARPQSVSGETVDEEKKGGDSNDEEKMTEGKMGEAINRRNRWSGRGEKPNRRSSGRRTAERKKSD